MLNWCINVMKATQTSEWTSRISATVRLSLPTLELNIECPKGGGRQEITIRSLIGLHTMQASQLYRMSSAFFFLDNVNVVNFTLTNPSFYPKAILPPLKLPPKEESIGEDFPNKSHHTSVSISPQDRKQNAPPQEQTTTILVWTFAVCHWARTYTYYKQNLKHSVQGYNIYCIHKTSKLTKDSIIKFMFYYWVHMHISNKNLNPFVNEIIYHAITN